MQYHKRQSLLEETNGRKMVDALKLRHDFLPSCFWYIEVLKKVEQGLQPFHENGLEALLAIELEFGDHVVQLLLVEHQGAFL